MKKIFKYSVHKVWIIVSLCLTYIFRIFPINKRKISFQNFFGKGYGCNSKYIAEYVLKNNLNYELVWFVKQEYSNIPSKIKQVKIGSLKYFYELATTKVFIDNQHKFLSFRKRKNQYLIRTWHATLGLKKIGLDNLNNTIRYKKNMIYNDKITNLMISNSDYVTQKFRRVFDYHGEIYKCGFPRNDILIQNDENLKQKIIEKIGISSDTSILLYAPTFRENNNLKYYNIDFNNLISMLEEKTNKKWIVLIKLHPHLCNYKIYDKQDNIINISLYDDIQELLLISDILITDYSNIMFEYGLTQKPCFLYEIYKKERDYYFTREELPFEMAINNDELIEMIKNFDSEKYLKKLDFFYKKLDFKENGNSTEMLIKKIEKIMNK